MIEQSYVVVPRDGFFFKDGRGWFTSASGRGHSLDWPPPPTLLGALRATAGRLLEASSPEKRFDGPGFDQATRSMKLGTTLPLRRKSGDTTWKAEHRCWPVPSNALYVRTNKKVLALQPTEPSVPTLGRDDDPAREALWVPNQTIPAKLEEPPRWWTNADLMKWLREEMPDKHSPDAKHALELPRRTDVHVGVDATTQAAEDGMLFTSETMEPMSKMQAQHWQWAIGLSGLIPTDLDLTSIPWTLGGDRRLARAECVNELMQTPVFKQTSKGLRLLVVTPAHFDRGWCPNGFVAEKNEYQGMLGTNSVVLRAALMDRPIHISGWDMARSRSKPTRNCIQPGAVYFFEKTDGTEFSPNDFTALWLAAIGNGTNEGLGRVIAGPWTPGTKERDRS